MVVLASRGRENFQNNNNNNNSGGSCPLSNVHPDNHLRDFVNGANSNGNGNGNNNSNRANHSGMNNRRRTRRGKDVIHKIRVTLEDLYIGKKQKYL